MSNPSGTIAPAQASRRSVLKGAAALSAMAAPGVGAAASEHAPALKKAIAAGHAASIKRLQDWIALPSIAAENLNYPAGPQYMAALARDAGFQHVEIVPTAGKPGVFATLDAGAKKTLGVYFMYDVKQFDPSEWLSPPLEGRIVDRPGFGKVLVGRGAENQKGPEANFLAAIHAFAAAGIKLPVNLVLVAEGEEEIASPNFPELLHKPQVLAALKRSVGVIVPAAVQDAEGHASISLGAKGALEMEFVVDSEAWGKGPSHDVHSSEKARVDSPPLRLVEALATLVSPDGNTIMIDGIPEMVVPLTARQKELIAREAQATDENSVKQMLGVKRWIGDMTWQQSLERMAQEPTFNIQGLISGYSGQGGKTILPHRAVAKAEMRLVPNMTREDTMTKIRNHLDKRGFQDVVVNFTGGYGPTETSEDAAVIKAGRAVYERMGVDYSISPRQAGSWPGVNFTGAPVSKPVISWGLGHGENIHAPNEFIVIETSHPKIKGMDDAIYGFADFFYQIAATS